MGRPVVIFCDEFFPRGIDKCRCLNYNSNVICRRSLVVKPQLPKLMRRVRFPSPAPKRKPTPSRGGLSLWSRHRSPGLRVGELCRFVIWGARERGCASAPQSSGRRRTDGKAQDFCRRQNTHRPARGGLSLWSRHGSPRSRVGGLCRFVIWGAPVTGWAFCLERVQKYSAPCYENFEILLFFSPVVL